MYTACRRAVLFVRGLERQQHIASVAAVGEWHCEGSKSWCVDIVRSLLLEGASVYVYDPRVAAEDVMKAFGCHRDVHVAGANPFALFCSGWGGTPSGLFCDDVGRYALHHRCHSTQRLRHRLHRLGGV